MPCRIGRQFKVETSNTCLSKIQSISAWSPGRYELAQLMLKWFFCHIDDLPWPPILARQLLASIATQVPFSQVHHSKTSWSQVRGIAMLLLAVLAVLIVLVLLKTLPRTEVSNVVDTDCSPSSISQIIQGLSTISSPRTLLHQIVCDCKHLAAIRSKPWILNLFRLTVFASVYRTEECVTVSKL